MTHHIYPNTNGRAELFGGPADGQQLTIQAPPPAQLHHQHTLYRWTGRMDSLTECWRYEHQPETEPTMAKKKDHEHTTHVQRVHAGCPRWLSGSCRGGTECGCKPTNTEETTTKPQDTT